MDLAWLLSFFLSSPAVKITVTCNHKKTHNKQLILFISFLSDPFQSSFFSYGLLFFPSFGGRSGGCEGGAVRLKIWRWPASFVGWRRQIWQRLCCCWWSICVGGRLYGRSVLVAGRESVDGAAGSLGFVRSTAVGGRWICGRLVLDAASPLLLAVC